MTKRTQEQLDADLIHAVREDMPGFVQTALDSGANPNATDENALPALFLVQARRYSAERSEVLELLLNSGADAQLRDEKGNTLMHLGAAVGADGIVVQMLEAGVDPLSENDRGLTPLRSITDRSTHQAAGRLEYAMAMPRVKLDENLTHSHLFGKDTLGNAPIDNSLSWYMFDQIVDQLAQNGEPPITKADLMECDKTAKPRIARAILCYNFDTVQNYLTARGEPLTHEDLLLPDGMGSQIAGALMAREKLNVFFTPEYWQDKPLEEMSKTYSALDEEAQGAVNNVHQLRASLRLLSQKRDGVQGR